MIASKGSWLICWLRGEGVITEDGLIERELNRGGGKFPQYGILKLHLLRLIRNELHRKLTSNEAKVKCF